MENIVVTVRVALRELTDYGMVYENFLDLLTERVGEKLGKSLDFFQIVDYSIVSHESAAVHIQVEGYEAEYYQE